jgi:hypothetical protein
MAFISMFLLYGANNFFYVTLLYAFSQDVYALAC